MILVLGGSGIIGQHLRLCQPPGETVLYTAREPVLPNDIPLDLRTVDDVGVFFEQLSPDVVINLTGENRPDVVEKNPQLYEFINTEAPIAMAAWCKYRRALFIHASSQAVLGGRRAPYEPTTSHPQDPPVNAYGRQKAAAEYGVLEHGGVVARLTFVLGTRPFPYVGRANPLEQMLSRGVGQMQVYDRLFSPCFAKESAQELWELVLRPENSGIIHIGLPIHVSRAEIAAQVLKYIDESPVEIQRVQHDNAFPEPDWAPRPFDTSFAVGARHRLTWDDGLMDAISTWRTLLDYTDITDRAVELGAFFGISAGEAQAKLAKGFGPLHQAVAEDFRRSGPRTDAELLAWYRETTAYIWELSAYHLDKGFNYLGMCDGITNHLVVRNRRSVLCLGDGIGDLSLRCVDVGLRPIYHDLAGSRTAAFADYRARRRFGHSIDRCETESWDPKLVPCEAVIALDFFEHLPNVEAWARAVFEALRPGGLFLAQNAFGIGSPDREGSIPCHLAINTHYETDWEPLLRSIGFVQEAGGWWQKP